MPFVDTSLKLEEMPVGSSRCFEAGEAQIGIFREPDGVFAVDNFCPHRGAPLHDGHVSEGVVTCPWHQWQFQIADGVCKNIPNVKIATYPVEVRDGVIWVNLESKGSA